MKTAIIIIGAGLVLAAMAYGSWLIYPPAGYLVPSAVLWIEWIRDTMDPAPPKLDQKGET